MVIDMAEHEALYKDVSSLEVVSYVGHSDDFNDGVNFILEKLDSIPTVDAVSKGAVEQIMWELDMAIQQLNEYGVQLGEKADCARVVRCKDCIHKHEYTEYLLYCFHHGMTKKYDDFCSYGECKGD